MIRKTTVVSGLLAVGLATALPAQSPLPFTVLFTIGRALPERSNAGAAFLAPGAVTNLLIERPCEVRLVYASENATQRNSVGWFTWREVTGGIEILDSRMLFPDVDRSTLVSGASLWLEDAGGAPRTFLPGERVGFFLVADGFRSAHELVTTWPAGTALPSTDPAANRAVGSGLFTSIPAINPEAAVDDGSRAGHVALVRMRGVQHYQGGAELLVLGFEDRLRTEDSDDDFNDAVFLVDVRPPDAIDRSAIALYDPADRDGDGVDGIEDAFPDDPARAWVRRTPAQGYTLLAFEDFYPRIGDGDFNDVAFAFAYVTVLDASNRVTDLIIDFHLVARGASYDHELGLHVPTLPPGVRGSVRIERFVSAAPAPEPVETRDLQQLVAGGRRIDRIFASTAAALPRAVPDKPFANTWYGHPIVPAASARLWIALDDPVVDAVLGPPPFDPFIFVTATDGTRADVHLPGFPSFDDRSPSLPRERGANAFLDPDGAPFALLVPTSWPYPLEGTPIHVAYPEYRTWRDSRGRSARDWYQHPIADPTKVAPPIDTIVPVRAWTLRGPADRF